MDTKIQNSRISTDTVAPEIVRIKGHRAIRLLPWVSPIIIIGFVLAVYGGSLNYGLYYDDNHFVRPWRLGEVLGTFAGPFDTLGIEGVFYRPLTIVSFGVDWLLWGYNSWGDRLSNILLYIIVAVLLYVFLRRIGLPYLVALIAGLLFIVIPSNAATAVYISERADSLAAIFVLTSLLCFDTYWRTSKLRWLVWALLAFIVALCAKEIALALPFFMVLYSLFLKTPRAATPRLDRLRLRLPQNRKVLFHAFTWGIQRLRSSRKEVRALGPFFGVLLTYLVYRAAVLPKNSYIQSYDENGNGVRAYFGAVLATVKAVPWFNFVPWTSLIVLLGIAFIFLVRPASRFWSTFFLGIGWILVTCLPLAALQGNIDPRLLYIPEIGYAICFGALLGIGLDYVQAHRNHPQFWPAAILLIFLTCTAFGVSVVENHRAQEEYGPYSPMTLTHDLEIYTDPAMRQRYPQHNIEIMREKLIRAGKIAG